MIENLSEIFKKKITWTRELSDSETVILSGCQKKTQALPIDALVLSMAGFLALTSIAH